MEPINDLTYKILNCAYKVHSTLGPGLLESTYEHCLAQEFIMKELKSVDQLVPIHKAQLLTYLKLSGKKTGLLINFNVVSLKDGIIRMVL